MRTSSMSQAAIFVIVAVQVSRFVFNANQLASARLTAGSVNNSHRPTSFAPKAMIVNANAIKASWINQEYAIKGEGARYG